MEENGHDVGHTDGRFVTTSSILTEGLNIPFASMAARVKQTSGSRAKTHSRSTNEEPLALESWLRPLCKAIA